MPIKQATITHLSQHLEIKGVSSTADEHQLFAFEVMRGRMAALFVDSVPVAVGGVRLDDGTHDGFAWLSIARSTPSEKMAAVVLMMRRVIRASRLYARSIRCNVDDGNAAGMRLARALKFEPTQTARNGLRVWVFNEGNVS